MKTDALIRVAHATEQTALEALQRRASLNNPQDRAALLANPDAIEVPIEQLLRGQVLVAEIAGEIVGFASVIPRDDGGAELDALFVEPSMWRCGIGRQLMDSAVGMARRHAARSIHVIGNPYAEGFYSACGFETAGHEKTRFGTGLLMQRQL